MLSKDQENIVIENLPRLLDIHSNESSEAILTEIGFCDEHTEEILGLITAANARFHFYKSGMKPKQFSGDFDSDRIFNATLNQLNGKKTTGTNKVLRLFKRRKIN